MLLLLLLYYIPDKISLVPSMKGFDYFLSMVYAEGVLYYDVTPKEYFCIKDTSLFKDPDNISR